MANPYFTLPWETLLQDSGLVEAGGTIAFFQAGTTTPAVIYADAAHTTPVGSGGVVTADSAGRLPVVYPLVDYNYKIVYKSQTGVTKKTVDPISFQGPIALSSNAFSLIDGTYYPAIGVNNQTGTTYAIQNSDLASLITVNNASGGTVTIAAPAGSNFPNKWYTYITNTGTGDFTITSPALINGGSIPLLASTGTLLVSNGSTYSALLTWPSKKITLNSATGTTNTGDINITGSFLINGVETAAYTTQVFTSGTAATYTKPVNARKLVVLMVGAAGGGGGAGTTPLNGTAGGATSFSTFTVNGGAGGIAAPAGAGGAGGISGTGTAVYRLAGQSGQNYPLSVASGGRGGSSGNGMGYGGNGADTDNATGFGGTNYGAGGGGAKASGQQGSGGGGAGEFAEISIASPAATYTYTVGGGGLGGGGTYSGGAGTSGIIIVREYY